MRNSSQKKEGKNTQWLSTKKMEWPCPQLKLICWVFFFEASAFSYLLITLHCALVNYMVKIEPREEPFFMPLEGSALPTPPYHFT